MRENKVKNMLITAVIVLSIIFLIAFNYYYLFISPRMIETKKVEAAVAEFEKENSKNVDYKSRYFLEDVFFSATDESQLYLFSEDGELLDEVALSKIDEEKVQTIAQGRYDKYSIAYAIIDNKPVYVIVSDQEDLFIDVETLEEVLVFRKGIAND